MKRFLLLQDDKEKLVDQILELDEENQKLREENDSLRKENEKLKKSPPSKFPPKKQSKSRSKPPSQWGRKPGHKGTTRPKPDQIDRDVEQTLKACPECKHKLGQPIESVEHIQEDIVPAHVEVTRYIHNRYWCSHCRVVLTAPYAPDEVPYGYLGPRALASMVLLKFYHGLPVNKIRSIFQDFCGLTVSEGAIPQALHRLARYLGVETDVILKSIQLASVKHADETGWKVNGVNHWLWAFINDHWAYYQIDRSRGSKVPKTLLGHPFKGVLISDFYSAYNRLSGTKQKCWVHLLREIRNARGKDPPDSFRGPEKKIKRILNDAIRLDQRRKKISRQTFRQRRKRIEKRFLDFAYATYTNKHWQRLSKRLAKYAKDLFLFLDVPGLSRDNNAAERGIRPHVIIRNRSYQNRTDNGSHAHSRLTSLIHTLQLQNKDPLSSIQAAYLHHRQGQANPILFP